jgi:hypothetical protein
MMCLTQNEQSDWLQWPRSGTGNGKCEVVISTRGQTSLFHCWLADITGLAALDWSLIQCKAHVGFMHYTQRLSGVFTRDLLLAGWQLRWGSSTVRIEILLNTSYITTRLVNCTWRSATLFCCIREVSGSILSDRLSSLRCFVVSLRLSR